MDLGRYPLPPRECNRFVWAGPKHGNRLKITVYIGRTRLPWYVPTDGKYLETKTKIKKNTYWITIYTGKLDRILIKTRRKYIAHPLDYETRYMTRDKWLMRLRSDALRIRYQSSYSSLYVYCYWIINFLIVNRLVFNIFYHKHHLSNCNSDMRTHKIHRVVRYIIRKYRLNLTSVDYLEFRLTK